MLASTLVLVLGLPVMTWSTSPITDPIAAYKAHKASAKQRGIPFRLSFADWWRLWIGRWDERCAGAKLCMCRTDDRGAYEPGNVRIDTRAGNNADRARLRK